MKFRVLAGSHRLSAEKGSPVYRVGDVLECDQDLTLLNPAHPRMDRKFERVDDNTPVTNPADAGLSISNRNDDLDGLSVAELKKIAAEEEVDISSLTKKDEIIRAIRRATAKV